MITRDDFLLELARDGAWTARQLAGRAGLLIGDLTGYLSRTVHRVRPTAWARRRHEAEIFQLNTRGAALVRRYDVTPQVIRTGEFEHALGLAELRWRCGIRAAQYLSQHTLGRDHRRSVARGGLGVAMKLPDGAFCTGSGVVLAEYDHGRYTAVQIAAKLQAFHQTRAVNGAPVIGAVWGAPTQRRAAWLRAHGVAYVRVMEPSTWLA